MKTMTFKEFAFAYCDRQDSTPSELHQRLTDLNARYAPDGFVLLECEVMDSSRLGERVILPYGPRNTLQTVPTHPISPRGLASDMSVVKGVMPANALDGVDMRAIESEFNLTSRA